MEYHAIINNQNTMNGHSNINLDTKTASYEYSRMLPLTFKGTLDRGDGKPERFTTVGCDSLLFGNLPPEELKLLSASLSEILEDIGEILSKLNQDIK